MDTRRPLTRHQLADLRGYVSIVPVVFRAFLFVAALAISGWIIKAIFSWAARANPLFGHPAWWIVPLLLLGTALYIRAGRWTGGRALRRQIRADIAGGEAAVTTITAVDAIEVEEAEDEGPAFFILDADGRTWLFAGQYLERLRGKGFPWQSFEILETPSAHLFLGLKAIGPHLQVSGRVPPLTLGDLRALGIGTREYAIVTADFAELKARAKAG